jgi:hypothetical protein
MGCGGSTPEVEAEEVEVDVTGEEGVTETERAAESLSIAEAEAMKAKPNAETFIGSVLLAKERAAENCEVLAECATRLQAYNERIKEYVAVYDALAIDEAMNGGFMGFGCNDNKLINAVCSRTKSQLQRTKKQYRDKYDKDMREEMMGETGGGYRKLLYFVLAAPDAYIADIIDMACNEAAILEFGCDEICLLEVFVTHTQEELQAGKAKWEGRTDKSLVDFINSNLGHSYRHLNRLLQLLFMGDRVETDETDEELAATQVGELKEECDKGWFEDFDESKIIEIIGANTTPQNQLVAQLFEKEHGESLASNLKDKCGERLFYALNALLLTKADFLAMRLHDAMKGWGTNQSLLTRLLGGLDGDKMRGVVEAYEQKYDVPLWSALKAELDGDFLKAALAWIDAIQEPARGAEKFTLQDVGEIADDDNKLLEMIDWLLLEHEALLGGVSALDVETVHEAVKGWGTDDTALIRALCTRSKRCLHAINLGYRRAHDASLGELLEDEVRGWYAYLAKFLVVQEEQADRMILDIAMADSSNVDTKALTEFLIGRHPKRVRAAKKAWEDRNDDSLVDRLSDSLEEGHYLKVCLTMLKGKREMDDAADEEQAAEQVGVLKTAVEAHEADEEDEGAKADLAKALINILCQNSPAENKELARAYEDAMDTSLRRTIKKVFDDDAEEALIALLYGSSDWYAAELKKALTKEDGVDDKAVCRIIGAADKDEIKRIAASYEKKYSTELKGALSDEIKGNYKRLAVAWVDLPDQLAQPEKPVAVPKSEDFEPIDMEM